MDGKNIAVKAVAFACAVALCTGCSGSSNSDPRGESALVTVEGSNTMTALVQSWAEQFMKKHPNIPVSVTADDSGSGISALIKRTTDLAAASRDMNSSELKRANELGEHILKLTVAGDAIVVLANPKNSVSELTLQQLQDIFSGAVTNWRSVGGQNKPIRVFSREKESGTYSYFLEHVLKGKQYVADAKILRSTLAITEAVENDPSSIAYEGLGNATTGGDKVKVIKIKLNADGQAIAPSPASAIANYPLSRPLIIFIDQNAKHSVRQFVDFCMSDEGQKLVVKAGYVRLR